MDVPRIYNYCDKQCEQMLTGLEIEFKCMDLLIGNIFTEMDKYSYPYEYFRQCYSQFLMEFHS